MKAKNTAEVEVSDVKLAPTAAKPLSKPVTRAAAAKPVVKVAPAVTAGAKPAAKTAPVAKAVAAKPVVKSAAVVKAVAKPAAKAVPVAKSEKDDKAEKESKITKKTKLKVVRDSFTMPQNEYQKISDIKDICLKAGLQVKKSEVLRAGVIALCAMSDEQLNSAMSALDKIKTGRPNKH